MLLLSTHAMIGCDQTATNDEAEPTVEQTADVTNTHSSVITADDRTDWSSFRGNAQLTGVAEAALSDSLELAWTFETGGAVVSSPVIHDGRVYVGSDDGNLYCLDLTTGNKLWAFETEYEIEAPPLYHDGMVYVGSVDFFFYCLNAVTGEVQWKFETNDTVIGSANIVEPIDDQPLAVVFGSFDNSIYCLDAKTGNKLWQYETLDRINGTPAILDNEIIFGGCDTNVYVLSPTGELLHEIPLGEECFVAASVAVMDGRVYAGHHANAFVCVDIDQEEIAWQYDNPRFGFFSAPAVNDELVVVGGRDSRVHGIDRATGEGRWTFSTRRKVDGSPVIVGNRVVFGSGDGRLYMISLDDGSEVWTYDIGKSIFSSPAVAWDFCVIGCNDGNIYSFQNAAE